MMWQCQKAFETEDGILDGHDGFKMEIPLLRSFLASKIEMDAFGIRPAYPGWRFRPPKAEEYDAAVLRLYQLWERVVGHYSGLKMTFIKDKLPAFNAITSRFAQLTKDKPILGLWETRLVQGLAWKCQEPSKAISDNPSWSWLSRDGPVTYDHGVPDLSGHQELHCVVPAIQCTEISITWSGTPMVSMISKAALHLRGRLREIKTDELRCMFDDGRNICSPTVLCVYLASVSNKWNSTAVVGYIVLLLDSSTQGEDSFRRSGIATIHTKSGEENYELFEGVDDVEFWLL